jgi:hypothetical protein
MEMMKVSDIVVTLRDLDISECNGHFQNMVAERIQAAGKNVNDITIGEMKTLIEKARCDYNSIWR